MPASDLQKTWSNELKPDAERFVAFQRWLAVELGERLDWPRDPARARRQIGQCRSFVERAVADLGSHGFLFRPPELAALITDHLDHIAGYQRSGKVHDIYQYLATAWNGWVGRNAEELAEKARRKLAHRSNLPDKRPRSLPEIVLKNAIAKDAEVRERREFRSAAARARKSHCSDRATPLLPGF